MRWVVSTGEARLGLGANALTYVRAYDRLEEGSEEDRFFQHGVRTWTNVKANAFPFVDLIEAIALALRIDGSVEELDFEHVAGKTSGDGG